MLSSKADGRAAGRGSSARAAHDRLYKVGTARRCSLGASRDGGRAPLVPSPSRPPRRVRLVARRRRRRRRSVGRSPRQDAARWGRSGAENPPAPPTTTSTTTPPISCSPSCARRTIDNAPEANGIREDRRRRTRRRSRRRASFSSTTCSRPPGSTRRSKPPRANPRKRTTPRVRLRRTIRTRNWNLRRSSSS